MELLRQASVKIGNYKCFREPQGFEKILPINVIIGRNNSGKSSLLDLIEFAANEQHSLPPDRGHRGSQPELIYGCRIDNAVVEHVFSHGWQDNRVNAQYIRSNYLGCVVEWSPSVGESLFRNFHVDVGKQLHSAARDPGKLQAIAAALGRKIGSPLSGYRFRRLLADRDIRSEDDQGNIDLRPDGSNATNIIQRYINQEELPRALVEETLLDELNHIFSPDALFRRILVQRKRDTQNKWEIYLDEEGKGRIPLSLTGSGLKTILLILINLYVIPKIQPAELSKYLFGFEEIENNLHLALQRRLFSHISEFAHKNNTIIFITTHSHVVVDMFSREKDAQIIHVQHRGETATAQGVTTFMHHGNLFRDLDVRASDLLQTNAVVWVEGPSDRIYFNRWVELWDNELKEGLHYQCVFSGGRLVEGFSFDDPDDPLGVEAEDGTGAEPSVAEFIEALRINRNAIVIMDRDRGQGEELKPWVRRIDHELTNLGGLPWVTAGREFENYIPLKVIQDLIGAKLFKLEKEPGQYDSLLKFIKGPKGGDLSEAKTRIAKRIVPNLTVELIRGTLDMAEKLDAVCDRIRTWNSMECRSKGPPEISAALN